MLITTHLSMALLSLLVVVDGFSLRPERTPERQTFSSLAARGGGLLDRNYSITRAPYKDAIIIVKARCAMEMVSMEVPTLLYEEIQSLAQETHSEPIEMLGRLVKMAAAQKDWLRDLNALRDQIKAEGGLTVGATKEQVVENLRQTRQEIFAAEYAHLY